MKILKITFLVFFTLTLSLSPGFCQIISFEAVSASDNLTLLSPFAPEKMTVQIGLEPRFSDYSYVDADNELHLSILFSYFSSGGFMLGFRLPYQWSWNVSPSRVLEKPSVIQSDGFEDMRIFSQFTIFGSDTRSFAAGLITTRTAQPRYWNENPQYRYDYSLYLTGGFRDEITEFIFSVMQTFHSRNPKQGDQSLSMSSFTSCGVAAVLFPRKRFQWLGEIIFQQSQPKFLSSSPKIETQNWYSFNFGWRFRATEHLIIKASITASFRNGFILFATDSEEDTFDLARETLQIFYTI